MPDLVGAVLSSMLPNGRINRVAGRDGEAMGTDVSRTVTGGTMGFVIFPVMLDRFAGLAPRQSGSGTPAAVKLLAPPLGGDSIPSEQRGRAAAPGGRGVNAARRRARSR